MPNNKLTTLDQLKTSLLSAKSYIDAQDAALSNRMDTIVADIEGIITTGGEANVLEGVKVNGAALAIADKMVDILIQSGSENGTISVNGAAVAVAGLADLAYKSQISEADMDDALKAAFAAKATDADLQALTVRVGNIESAGYQTAEQVQAAIAAANHLKYAMADTVPSVEEADANTWYMVYNEETKHYDIYGLIEGEMRLIDDTTIDLTGYSTTEAMQAWVAEQIASLKVEEINETLETVVVDVAAIQTALANVYTKEEADAKFTDEAETQAIAEAAVAAATASDEEVSAAVDEVFGSED